MSGLLNALLLRLPIVKMMLRHNEERCEAQCQKNELLQRQHDLARRVHILEWMTFPHTDPNGPDKVRPRNEH